MKNSPDTPVRVNRKLLAKVKVLAKKEGRTLKGEVERGLNLILQTAEAEKKISG